MSGTRRKNLLSSESPRHNNSSIFFVIILVTSCRSSLSLSRLDPAVAARVSWYSLAVLDMNVSVYSWVSRSILIHTSLQRLTKADKCIWPPDGLDLWAIRRGELLREFIQVRKGKFSRVRFVRNGQIYHIICYKIATRYIIGISAQVVAGQLRTYWCVYGPLSMERRGSEFEVRRLNSTFACCLCSCKVCSV